jgi:hypothetical protein
MQETAEICSHCEHAKHYVTYRIKQTNKGLIWLIIFLPVVVPVSTVRFLHRAVSNILSVVSPPENDWKKRDSIWVRYRVLRSTPPIFPPRHFIEVFLLYSAAIPLLLQYDVTVWTGKLYIAFNTVIKSLIPQIEWNRTKAWKCHFNP